MLKHSRGSSFFFFSTRYFTPLTFRLTTVETSCNVFYSTFMSHVQTTQLSSYSRGRARPGYSPRGIACTYRAELRCMCFFVSEGVKTESDRCTLEVSQRCGLATHDMRLC